ncbi:hypothetical protein V8C86DRAFT_2435100 [Haematococcus lacustris]
MAFTALLACMMFLHAVTDAQLTDTMPAPSPPILSPRPPVSSLPTQPRPPVPSLSRPPPQLLNATGIQLLITLYGLDLWSLINSWGSSIQAVLEAHKSPSLSLLDLSAPGMCASQLLALNTTALFSTSRTAQDLMPGLGFFATDMAQLLRDFLRDSSITVQVQDFCAGNRTAASFLANNTTVNGPWPTLLVTINLLTTEPERLDLRLSLSACRLSSPTGPLRQLPVNCAPLLRFLFATNNVVPNATLLVTIF